MFFTNHLRTQPPSRNKEQGEEAESQSRTLHAKELYRTGCCWQAFQTKITCVQSSSPWRA